MNDTIRAFIPCDGLVIDGDLVDGKIVGQWQQDIKDGAALRRLTERIAEGGYTRSVVICQPDVDHPRNTACDCEDNQWCVSLDENGTTHKGLTFAEAADKCREAL